MPKTLIFAKDDSHAEDIVDIVRKEFGKGNDFCKKVTYWASGKSEDIIKNTCRILMTRGTKGFYVYSTG